MYDMDTKFDRCTGVAAYGLTSRAEFLTKLGSVSTQVVSLLRGTKDASVPESLSCNVSKDHTFAGLTKARRCDNYGMYVTSDESDLPHLVLNTVDQALPSAEWYVDTHASAAKRLRVGQLFQYTCDRYGCTGMVADTFDLPFYDALADLSWLTGNMFATISHRLGNSTYLDQNGDERFEIGARHLDAYRRIYESGIVDHLLYGVHDCVFYPFTKVDLLEATVIDLKGVNRAIGVLRLAHAIDRDMVRRICFTRPYSAKRVYLDAHDWIDAEMVWQQLRH